MNRRFFLTFGLVAVLAAFFALTLPAQASPTPQLVQYATPTPQPDGRIIYVVKEGDNCISIAALNGVGLDQLYKQNPQLETDCSNLVPGMQLLLGIGGPAAYTPTPGPSPTPSLIPPTPTPFSGTTAVCVLLYNDLDGNAQRAETEFGLDGGQVSVIDVNGAYTDTKSAVSAIDPDTEEPVRTCFDDVPGGVYNVTIAVPDGYNPTTDISARVKVKAGDTVMLAFGAQSKEVQAAPEEPSQEPSKFPVMGVVGAFLLLGGLGMGWYALRMRRPDSKFGGKGMLK